MPGKPLLRIIRDESGFNWVTPDDQGEPKESIAEALTDALDMVAVGDESYDLVIEARVDLSNTVTVVKEDDEYLWRRDTGEESKTYKQRASATNAARKEAESTGAQVVLGPGVE